MYRVLYRKWRPQVFSDVVGQPQVTLTLSSQIKENRLAHAYLFTGSRGTGKTTCAKILSKAVNCLNPVNGDPCNECEICKGIDNGTILDIVEIDAASNRGIDDIRLLRDEANFMPSKAKYRVYIIDEVHMLTIEAFNALLKTLEEPPEHVKFILATTEVHKLPSTILSRCQRFDFRRIEPKLIADRLCSVAQAENAVLHEDAAMLIARIADGGMRDALSLLDRAISVDNEVTTAVVSSSAGLMGREYIYDLIRAIANRDTAKSLVVLDDLHNASCDTERLLTELNSQFRNFLILKTVEHPENLIVCTEEELGELRSLSELFTSQQVINALNVLTSTAEAVKKTQNRRIEAEMALIRLCSPETDSDISALLARISILEKELAEIKARGVTLRNSPAETGREATEKAPPTSAFGTSESRESVLGADNTASEEKTSDEGDFPFGPDAGGEIPKTAFPESDFEGFGSEPDKGSFNDRFSFDVEEEEVSITDGFMEKYGSAESEVKNAVDIQSDVPQSSPGNLDERTWVKVILSAEQANRQLIGQLTNSTAKIKGDTLFVHPASPFIKNMTPEHRLQEYVAPAVEKILGKKYTVRYDD